MASLRTFEASDACRAKTMQNVKTEPGKNRLNKNGGCKQANRLKLGVKTEEKNSKRENHSFTMETLVLHIDKGLTAFPFKSPIYRDYVAQMWKVSEIWLTRSQERSLKNKFNSFILKYKTVNDNFKSNIKINFKKARTI